MTCKICITSNQCKLGTMTYKRVNTVFNKNFIVSIMGKWDIRRFKTWHFYKSHATCDNMTQLLSLVHWGTQGKEIPNSTKKVPLQWQGAIKTSAEDSEIPGMDRKS